MKIRNKIIWAMDPTQNLREAQKAVRELTVWAKHLGCDILPVSIFSKSAISFPLDLAFPFRNNLSDIAKKSVTHFLKSVHAKGFLEPELVFINGMSTRKMAAEMAKYAEKKNALLILANTRARKTWNPFRLGGFAETLVATSRVPVLLLNPTAAPTARIPAILFPTDFSRESKRALLRLEPWAKAFKSKVVIYNQVEIPTMYPVDLNGLWSTESLDPGLLTKDAALVRVRKAKDWSQILQKQNINSVALVQRQRKHLAGDILDVAKKNKISLIAIASLSGPATQALMGSVARDILFKAKCPVLIFYRPKAIRKHRALSNQIMPRRNPKQQSSTHQSEVYHA